ncbi:MAG: TolC family protein [Planctomycetes bacterium]|nr:TolC family protein [Planctomycetota bacterium]
MKTCAAIAAVTLAGCASPAPRAFTERPPDARPGEAAPAPAAIDWSDGLSLAEVMSSISRHGRVLAALEDLEAARARRVTAGTYPLNPEVSFDGAQSVDGDTTTLGIGLHQTFELGGRVGKREAVADAGITRSAAEAEDMRRDLGGKARRAYWSAVAAERRVEIARKAAETADKVVEVATARFDARQAAAIDVNLAKVGAGQARAGVRRAEGEAASARAVLMAFVPGEVPATWNLSDHFTADRPEVDLSKALAAAQGNRSDLAALNAAAEESDARARLAEAEAAPDLGVGIGYEFGRDRIEGDGVDFRTSEHSVKFGLSLTLPIINRRRGEIAEAEADRRRFIALHAALASEVGRDVSAAEARLRAAGDVLALYEKEILPSASRNIDDVRSAYAAGEVAISELLRAQESFQSVQGEAVEAEAAYADALADLEAAVGRPLSEFAK